MPVAGRGPRPPRRRDRHGSWREASFASLDFETTGLDFRRDAVISFGVVPVERGRIVVGDAFGQLVSPSVPASASSMRVHHLLPKDLAGAPDLATARDLLRAELEGRFVLAWFADLEIAFLARTFGTSRGAWRRRTIDVRRLVLALEGLPRDTRNTLAGTAERFGVPVSAPHDALDDALVAGQLFLVLASRLDRARAGRVSDLLALTRRRVGRGRLERRVRTAV